jgi:hypothetical protein
MSNDVSEERTASSLHSGRTRGPNDPQEAGLQRNQEVAVTSMWRG